MRRGEKGRAKDKRDRRVGEKKEKKKEEMRKREEVTDVPNRKLAFAPLGYTHTYTNSNTHRYL